MKPVRAPQPQSFGGILESATGPRIARIAQMGSCYFRYGLATLVLLAVPSRSRRANLAHRRSHDSVVVPIYYLSNPKSMGYALNDPELSKSR